MSRSIFKRLFRPTSHYLIKPDEYLQKFIQEIAQLRPEGTLTCADLLTLRRMDDPGTWNVTSTYRHLVPHSMKLHTESGVHVLVSGFRSSDEHVSSYISAPGLHLKFEADSTRCVFQSEGNDLVVGGSIFGPEFELNARDRRFLVLAPNRRPDWNSAWQKPSHIVIQESGGEFCRLVLQPFRPNKLVVESHSAEALGLAESHLLSLLSLAVILNARFVN